MTGLANLAGFRFGAWTVIQRAKPIRDNRGQRISRWKCDCDCGNEEVVRQHGLLTGSSTHCKDRRRHPTKVEIALYKQISFYPGQSLAERSPELSKEWHPTKNGNLLPSQVRYRSNKKA